MSAAARVSDEFHVGEASIDFDLPYMKFGVVEVASDMFESLAHALKIGSRHSVPRGGVVLTDRVHEQLDEDLRARCEQLAGDPSLYLLNGAVRRPF